MEAIATLLQHCPLFDDIYVEDIRAMLGCLGARTLRAEKGSTLFHEGDPANFVGIVLSGSVRLVREDFYGNRSIVARVGPMQLFAEAYAFSTLDTLPVRVDAEEDCHLLLLDSRRITACCAHACSFHNQVIFNLLRMVSGKNLILHQKIHITSQRTTREKLMTYLLTQAKQQGSRTFTIPYDRQALADFLEVDRSGLSAEISKLRREGILESEKSTFTLLQAHFRT